MKSDNKALSAVAGEFGFEAAKIDVAYYGMDAVIEAMSEIEADRPTFVALQQLKTRPCGATSTKHVDRQGKVRPVLQTG